MSERQAEPYRALADRYDAEADKHPDGSLGRIANRAEAAKYHDLAARAEGWPDPEHREAKQCSKQIDGPKIAKWVVAWRKPCRNRTTHPSGLCYVHRRGDIA